MSAGRRLAALAVIAAGMLAAGLLISRTARTLHNDGLFHSTAPSLRQPGPAAAPTHQLRHGPTPRHAPVTRLRRAPRHGRPTRRPTAAPVKLVRQRPGAKRSGGLLGLGELKVVLVAALEIAAGVALLAHARHAAGAAARASALAAPLRALRASPLYPRSGQTPGPRGHGRVDREHHPCIPRRARPRRTAVHRAGADLRPERAGHRVVGEPALRALLRPRARRGDQRHLPRRAHRTPALQTHPAPETGCCECPDA